MVSGATFVAIGVVVLAVALLYRKITSIGWMSKWLLAGVLATMAWIIFAGSATFMPRWLWIFRREHFTFRTDSF